MNNGHGGKKKKGNKGASARIIPSNGNGKNSVNGGVVHEHEMAAPAAKSPVLQSSSLSNHTNGTTRSIPPIAKEEASSASLETENGGEAPKQIAIVKLAEARELEDVLKKHSELQKELSLVTAELQASKERVESLVAQNQELEDCCVVLKERLTELNSSKESLQQKLLQLEEEVLLSRSRNVNIGSEVASLAFYKQRTQVLLEHRQQECRRLEAEVQHWKSQAQTPVGLGLLCEKKNLAPEEPAAVTKNTSTVEEVQRALARSKALEEEKKKLSGKCQVAVAACETLKREKEVLLLSNSSLTYKVRELEVTLAKAATELKLMSVEAKELKEDTAKWVIPVVVTSGMCLSAGLLILLKASFSRTYTG